MCGKCVMGVYITLIYRKRWNTEIAIMSINDEHGHPTTLLTPHSNKVRDVESESMDH